jgi:hypothetical protein
MGVQHKLRHLAYNTHYTYLARRTETLRKKNTPTHNNAKRSSSSKIIKITNEALLALCVLGTALENAQTVDGSLN